MRNSARHLQLFQRPTADSTLSCFTAYNVRSHADVPDINYSRVRRDRGFEGLTFMGSEWKMFVVFLREIAVNIG